MNIQLIYIQLINHQYTLVKEEIQEIKLQKSRNKKVVTSFLNSMSLHYSIIFFEDWLNYINVNELHLQISENSINRQ